VEHRIVVVIVAMVVMGTVRVEAMETKRKNNKQRSFSLQWHITVKCDQNCSHCYVRDERTYRNELEAILAFDDCKKVIDDEVEFCQKLEATPHIAFTGGDPLLREDFFEIVKYARKKGVIVSVMGNPYHLNEENIAKLKSLGIRGYQISIDGLKETHDRFRKENSFDRSIEAIKDLRNAGIRTVVMFTISKENADDLLPVMELVSDLSVDVFAFARVCNYGNGEQLESLTPVEYRKILLQAYEKEKELIAEGSTTKFNKKDHLWIPLLEELGEISCQPTSDNIIYGGCSIGIRSLCILSDGTAFACRRFYSPIGKVPDQTIEELFLSAEMDHYRNAHYEKCSLCDLFQYCRGCPAVAYNNVGRFGAPDPQCWR
jgi:radical SAM/SPASM domain protein of ACGX system